MKYQRGAFVFCDRCGEKFFLNLIGQDEFDGGWTVKDKFEDLPSDWKEVIFQYQGKYNHKLLCPVCASVFTSETELYEQQLKDLGFVQEETTE